MKQMIAKHVFVEISLPKEITYIAEREGINGYHAHLELKINGSIHRSRVFEIGQYSEKPLIKVPLPDLSVPLKEDMHFVAKVFVHILEEVYLLGLQDVSLYGHNFPLKSKFPIVSKHGNDRILNLNLTFASSEQDVEKVVESSYKLGELELPGSAVIRGLITEAASKIANSKEKEMGKKSPMHLMHGVALAALSLAKKALGFAAPMKYLIRDEFADRLLSRETHFIHSPDATTAKNIYVDLAKKRMIIAKSDPRNPLMKVHHSAMTLLPNGNYIIAGGNSKDAIVSHHGLYYMNPSTGQYTKISEIAYNLHKHELHYHKGNIMVFGGIDMKDDKGGQNSESTTFASTIYRFNLANRLWTKGEKMTQKSNERCPSILHGDTIIVNKGNDTCEVFKPSVGQWKAVKVVTKDKNASLSMLHPSTFFMVSDQIHVCYRKNKDDTTKYAIGKINLTEKNVECAHVADIQLNNLAMTKVSTQIQEGKVVDSVYFYDASGTRMAVFRDGVYDQKGTPTDRINMETITDPQLTAANIGKPNENCSTEVLSTLDSYREMCVENVPKVLPEDITDAKVKQIHQGIGHCQVPLLTGNSVLLGYFEKVKEDLYKPNLQATTLRVNIWSAAQESVLYVPSNALKTVSHAAIKARNSIFIIGGLEVLDREATFSSSEVQALRPKDGVLRATNHILAYRLSNQDWKVVDFLPEPLYNSRVHHIGNSLWIYGGINQAGEHTKKIYRFDLETYSLIDTSISFELDLEKTDQLMSINLGEYVLLGSKNLSKTSVHSFTEKKTYTVNCNLFCNFELFSFEDLKAVSGEFACLYVPTGQNKQLSKKFKPSELIKLLEAGSEEIKKFFSEAENTTDLPETYSWRSIQYKETHDLYALDEIDHSKSFSDYLKQPKFAVLSEGKDSKMSFAEYSYKDDTISWPVTEETMEEKKPEESKGFQKGLLSIPFQKNSSSCSLGNGRILISGGQRAGNGKLVASNRCWSFDPITNTYTVDNKMKSARSHHCTLRVGRHVYCFGGRVGSSGSVLAESERYDIFTGEWERIASLPMPLCKLAASMIFNKIYLFGGETEGGILSSKIFVYDIHTNAYEDEAVYHEDLKLPIALRSLIAVRVAFNTIAVAGGESNGESNMNIYFYEFSEGHLKSQPKICHSALYSHVGGQGALVDGKLLLVGGNDLNGSEAYCIRGGLMVDYPRLREQLGNTAYSLSEIKSEYYTTDSFLHSNPKYKHLYMFGLDQRRDIWR